MNTFDQIMFHLLCVIRDHKSDVLLGLLKDPGAQRRKLPPPYHFLIESGVIGIVWRLRKGLRCASHQRAPRVPLEILKR